MEYEAGGILDWKNFGFGQKQEIDCMARLRSLRKNSTSVTLFIASLQDAWGLWRRFPGFQLRFAQRHPGLFSYRPYGTRKKRLSAKKMRASETLSRHPGEGDTDQAQESEGEGKLPGRPDFAHRGGVDALSGKHEKEYQQELRAGGNRGRDDGDGADGEADGGECGPQGTEQLANKGLGAMVDAAYGEQIQRQTGYENVIETAHGDEKTGDREDGAGDEMHGASRKKVAQALNGALRQDKPVITGKWEAVPPAELRPGRRRRRIALSLG